MSRIAVLVPSLLGGGAEFVGVALANSFRARGQDVDLVVVDGSRAARWEPRSDIRVVDLRSGRALRAIPALRRYLARETPDALLAIMYHMTLLGVLADRARWRGRTRIVGSEQNHLARALSSVGPARRAVLQRLIERCYPRTRAMVAASHGIGANINRRFDERDRRPHVEVVYNPIVSPALWERARAPVDHPWIEKEDVTLLVACGRLVEEKDYPTMLRTLARLDDELDARLIVLGEGPLRSELERLARHLGCHDRVDLLGWVDNPQAYMARADVFLHTAAWEGFGNVIAEALALGVPIVATDCPDGPGEILDGGRFGNLVPVGDDAAVANGVREALVDPRRVPPEALERFDLDRVTDCYLELLLAASAH